MKNMSARKPIEKEIYKSENIWDFIVTKYSEAELKDRVYFHKMLMGVSAAIACSIVAIIQMYTHLNYGITFFGQSISVGMCWLGYLLYFILGIKVFKHQDKNGDLIPYEEELGGKSKILLEGVGAFIFIWIFVWTIINTIAWVAFYGLP